VQRYRWEKPDDTIHVDTKQLARFELVRYGTTGDRHQGTSKGAGYEKGHVAVGDATRLAYVKVLRDEQKASIVGFLTRAVGWFPEQGITCRRIPSDDCSSYRSGEWRKACNAINLKPIRTKPYTPRTKGKTGRSGLQATVSTSRLSRSRDLRNPYQTWADRFRGLPHYLVLHNGHRWPSDTRWPQPAAVHSVAAERRMTW